MQTTYLHEVDDRCSHKTVVSEQKVVNSEQVLEFHIQNPNLTLDIMQSFDLVPMTHDEAVQALAQAQSDCEKYQSVDSTPNAK